MTINHEAMQLLRAEWERASRKMPPLDGVYPDYLAPVAVQGGDGRKMKLARWGGRSDTKYGCRARWYRG